MTAADDATDNEAQPRRVIGRITVERPMTDADRPLLDWLDSLDLPLGNGPHGEGKPEDS